MLQPYQERHGKPDAGLLSLIVQGAFLCLLGFVLGVIDGFASIRSKGQFNDSEQPDELAAGLSWQPDGLI